MPDLSGPIIFKPFGVRFGVRFRPQHSPALLQLQARATRRFRCFLSPPCDLNAIDIEENPSSEVLIAQGLLYAGGWSVERMLIGVRPEFLF